MATVKRMVCLANSRKLSGRCIAGREVVNGQPQGWLRPVSTREREEVSEYERQYKDGSDPLVRDVIDVPLLDPRPKAYQRENWLLDPQYYWEKVGRATCTELSQFEEPEGSLWVDGYDTFRGRNDKIPLQLAEELTSSLRLIRVVSLRLSVFAPGMAFDNSKRRVLAQFSHESVAYWLWVTDPEYERHYLAQPDGEYDIGEAFLTLSLSEPYNDWCHKLVAAIIECNGAGGP